MRIGMAPAFWADHDPHRPAVVAPAGDRTFGELSPGSLLDDLHSVQSVEMVPYRHDATYDILPGSSTGTYFAAGALVGSTLATGSASSPRL